MAKKGKNGKSGFYNLSDHSHPEYTPFRGGAYLCLYPDGLGGAGGDAFVGYQKHKEGSQNRSVPGSFSQEQP